MQNKGAIRLFAIALALVCIYQLSFTFVTYRVEKKADDLITKESIINRAEVFAMGDDNRKIAYLDSVKRAYLDSISSEVVYNFLGFRKYTFRECKEKEINLGLDLRGGMNVTLEVSVVDMLHALANYNRDTTFIQAIQIATERQKASQADFLTLFNQAFLEIDPDAQLAAIFSTVDLRDRITFNSTNQEVMTVLRREIEGAIENSFNIITSRIDQFGVVQPKIQQLETQGRILVELPGVDDPDRVRRILQSTANLEFWETYENSELYEYLLAANERLREIQSAERQSQRDVTQVQEDDEQELLVDDDESELPELFDQFEQDEDITETPSLLDQLEREPSLTDTDELVPDDMMDEYPLFALLQPNVSRDNQLLPGSVIGFAHARHIDQVNAYLSSSRIRPLFPRDVKFYWSVKPIKDPETNRDTEYFELHAIKVTTRDGRPPLDGDVVTNARAEFGQSQASAEVSMSMNAEGAKVWARITRDNVGRCIAIVLDDRIYSSPRVNQEIRGGSSQITSNFTIREAQDLANVLKSGKLPARARIIQEAVVGPSLGQEAINAGLNSFLIAFLLVMIYMIFYYSRRAGVVSDIALIVNLFFIMGVLASLGAVLTLPGIAGIVLTIGMSVDANVLIYERIREELRAGKGIKLAISDGYKNAYSAIIDANVTTLLTGIVLYIFGTGPIKGFATTLVIGICTSLFTAIFITRLIFIWFLDKNWKISFATNITRGAFEKINIKFIEKRKVAYFVSGLLLLASVFSLSTRGLQPGIDFTGGRSYIVRFAEPVSTVDIQAMLRDVLDDNPEVIIFGQDNQVRITTSYLIDESGIEVDSIVNTRVYEGLLPALGEDVTYSNFSTNYLMEFQKVGPSIAHDLKTRAIWVIIFSLTIIFVYILIRFRTWHFGLGALAALIHDVTIVMGLYSILYGIMPFSLEIDQAFIAAILTVVGYSINDTVVVFDRIREFFKLYPKRERIDVYDAALNSTISRTFNTSMTTFVVLMIIFIFGGEVIRGFIFALVLGVVIGTYSSVFVATPVVYDTYGAWMKRKKNLKK